MRTKKIQITNPHGEGISGSWVVRNRMVCGCVFAAYNTGRYLHMLPIEDILNSISQFTNATSVRIALSHDLEAPSSSGPQHPGGLADEFPDEIRWLRLDGPEAGLQGALHTPFRINTASSSSSLDPRYQVRTDPRRFFRQGRVFSVLWHENAGAASHKTEATFIAGQFGEPVYSHIRRMVVVKEYGDCAWCFPIYTYQGRGVSKNAVDASKHAVIYMEGSKPATLPSEPRMLSKALELRPLCSDDKLSPMARLNFGKLFTVEHNVKVRPIGKISEQSMPDFLAYARREIWA
ncbi:hypothetical protein HFD88_000844 [Aspergillus terreus]|nr:hypothetical protein HFD88_000844 [Aspergillus terreus]